MCICLLLPQHRILWARIRIIWHPGTRTQGYKPQLWSAHQLGWSERISPGKGRRHQLLFGYVVGCVGFQRKRDFFQGCPLLQQLYICTLFSKQEPCSLSQVSATISWAWVEQESQGHSLLEVARERISWTSTGTEH